MDRAKKRAQQAKVDAIRRRSNPVQNHVIDELAYGKLSRREFIRKGSLLGLSLPVMGFLVSACTEDTAGTTAAPGTTAAGPTTTVAGATTTAADAGPVTLNAGFLQPPGPVDPVIINDEPRLALLGQTASYLIFSDQELNARPQLAESWESNDSGDVWTFTLREGVNFQNGSEVTAEDVVASFQGIAEGNALSAFQTFAVTADSVEALDERTVQFTLERPNGSFPFFVSSDNYNAAILPTEFWQNYSEGSYEQEFPGTGPWIMDRYDPGVSATLVKNPDYFGDNPRQADRLEISFFAEEAPMVAAFQEGRIDMIVPNLSFAGGRVLIDDPEAVVTNIPTAQHRQIYFDTSKPPFQDKRVRQAIALTLRRPDLIDGLLGGFGVLGNDHPIWEVYPMYNPGAASQREEDLTMAQQLIEAAGGGFDSRLDTLVFREVEDLATLIQSGAGQIGVNLEVNITDAGTYYGDFWLAADASMGIVNYGHRGVPDVYLGAPLLSDGDWNASHWVNEDYDRLFGQYTSAVDLDTQREVAGEIQALLWDEVPFVVPYFLDNLAVTRPGIEGVEVTGMGHVNLVDTTTSGG